MKYRAKGTIKENKQSKGRCDECFKICRVRRLIYFKGRFLCPYCKRRRKNSVTIPWQFSLKQALNKNYTFKLYPGGVCNCSFPNALENKKVQLILIKKGETGNGRISLQEALDRIYTIKLAKNGHCYLSVPHVLANSQIKLKIINENENENETITTTSTPFLLWRYRKH